MAAEIRFYCDECVPDAVAQGLARRRISVSTSAAVGLAGADDEAQLAQALRDGRVLVTQDSDFLRLAARGEPHCGIAYYAPGTRSVGQVIHFLARLRLRPTRVGRRGVGVGQAGEAKRLRLSLRYWPPKRWWVPRRGPVSTGAEP